MVFVIKAGNIKYRHEEPITNYPFNKLVWCTFGRNSDPESKVSQSLKGAKYNLRPKVSIFSLIYFYIFYIYKIYRFKIKV